MDKEIDEMVDAICRSIVNDQREGRRVAGVILTACSCCKAINGPCRFEEEPE